MPSIDRSQTVAELVTDHAELAHVFQEQGIDFCCEGKVSVDHACRARGLDAEKVYDSLERAVAERAGEGQVNFSQLSTRALVDHIVSKHHGYLAKALPFLLALSAKVARVHGEHNPKLIDLERVFGELEQSLQPHLEHEEQVLFPALLSDAHDPGIVRAGLDEMFRDHVVVGRALASLRSLSDEYTTPEWGCNSYRTLMAELHTLENDTFRHVHLENHVLMPRFAA